MSSCGRIETYEQAPRNLDKLGREFQHQGEIFVDYLAETKRENDALEREHERRLQQPIIIKLPQIVIVTPTPLPKEPECPNLEDESLTTESLNTSFCNGKL